MASKLRSPFAAQFDRILGKKAEDDDVTKPDKPEDQDEAERLRKVEKKAKDKEDDDDETDIEDDEEAKKGRAHERSRIRAILVSEPGLQNPIMAAHLALDTAMPAKEAIAAIGGLNSALAARDAEHAQTEHEGRPDVSVARAILAAGAKARGEEVAPVPPGRRERMGLRAGEEQPRQARQGRDLDGYGRLVSPVAQAIIDAGKRARGEG